MAWPAWWMMSAERHRRVAVAGSESVRYTDQPDPHAEHDGTHEAQAERSVLDPRPFLIELWRPFGLLNYVAPAEFEAT